MPTIETVRRYYPVNDAVHGFEHVLRVLHMAERLAQAAGADLEIVRAAALLHDAAPEQAEAGDAAVMFSTAEEREKHHHASADLAARVLQAEGWAEERIAAVQHCIRSHRFRDSAEPPLTLEAQVLFDADKLDAIGAIGVARAIGYAAQAGQPAWARPRRSFCRRESSSLVKRIRLITNMSSSCSSSESACSPRRRARSLLIATRLWKRSFLAWRPKCRARPDFYQISTCYPVQSRIKYTYEYPLRSLTCC